MRLNADTHQATCRNCDASLTGAYCAACGQPARLHDTVAGLFHEFAHGVAHFDGRLWRTLPLLALDPGRLSREWIAGRRARYIAPLPLFLFAVFLLFTIPTLTGDRLISIQTGAASDDRTEPAVPPDTRAVSPPADEAMVVRLLERIAENPDYYGKKIEVLAYKFAFLAAPLSAALLALLLGRRGGFSFYGHVVVALYGLGFLALLVSVLYLLPDAFSTILLVVPPLHAFVHLRGAYCLSMAGAAVRTALLVPLTVIGFFALLVGVVLAGVGV